MLPLVLKDGVTLSSKRGALGIEVQSLYPLLWSDLGLRGLRRKDYTQRCMPLNSVQMEFLVSPTLILSLLSALPEQGSRSLSRCTMWDANGGSPSSRRLQVCKVSVDFFICYTGLTNTCLFGAV